MFKHPFDFGFNGFTCSLRKSYFKQYRKYKKLVKYIYKEHVYKNIFAKLDKLDCSVRKTYWILVNYLKKW